MEPKFKAFSEDHKIKGSLIANYKMAIDSEEFAPFFEAHGFGQVDPKQWYRAQDMLDVFNDMQAASKGLFDFVSVGMSMGATIEIPAQVDQTSPEQMLAFLEQVQAVTAQTSRPGYVRTECLSSRHYRISIRSTMPDNVAYGLLYAFAKRAVTKSASIILSYPEGGQRRDHGDEFTLFDLRWE